MEQWYPVMDEEADLFEDAISVNSVSSGSTWKKGKDYISLSRCTIYHSAQDLQEPSIEEVPMMSTTQEPLASAVNSTNVPLTSPSMFKDQGDSVDFVLVWTESNASSCSEIAVKKREIFERNLLEDGLMLEREQNQSLHFVKINAPSEVLMRYTEILKLRMPMKKFEGSEDLTDPSFDIMDEVKSIVHRFMDFVHVDPKIFEPHQNKLSAEFSRDKIYLFDVENSNFFTASVRTSVVDYILERARFSDDEEAHFAFGVNRLVSDGVYSAAYPLHDGDYKAPGCLRYLLHHEWASIRKWIMYQPIDHIKDYFGVKFGLYFAWLGFYTHMLIPAAIVGLICFIYGLATMYSNTLSEDICNKSLNIVMCPLCDNCHFWNLTDACDYARVTYLFDNPFTVFFAFFMSFWGTLFLELWKRYSADITHHWGLTGFDVQAEHPRPEYLARLRDAKVRINVITNTQEPYVPFWKVRVPATILSFSVVLLLITVAVAAVFGVVFYRMASLSSQSIFHEEDKRILVPATAALINLVFIMLLNYFYDWLAVKLTELELLRTQTEFDDSLTLKIYLFQFVNYYTSIFYIAFLKGKFVGYPLKYNRIFGMRQEECSPGGCLMELCIQLAIIMVGKQAYNTILEMIIPLLFKWWNTFKIKTGIQEEEKENKNGKSQWIEDYKLLDWGPRGLFPEYLEMILQYGFITIFVAAFPLAPFFALLNNVLEMRLDAKKFLRFYRRPVPKRVKNIGVWFRILDILGRISVVTNAFIIAFSSNFIPRLVYMITVNKNHTDIGFLNHSLAYFNTSHYKDAEFNTTGYPLCRYQEYRNAPWEQPPYKRPPIYWHVLAARLAFVVVFQNVVSIMMMAVQWLIPDMSRKLRDEMRKEAFLTSEIIIAQERKRAQGMLPGKIGSGDFIKEEMNSLVNSRGVHKRKKVNDPEEICLTDIHTDVS